MSPLFIVSILTQQRHDKTKWSQRSRLADFSFFQNHTLESAGRYKSSAYSCGDGGVMRGWQIQQSYDICGLGAFPHRCWHASVLHDVSSPPRQSRSGLRCSALRQQIQLAFPRRQSSAVRMTHCNMMKLYTNDTNSIQVLWETGAKNHTAPC